MKKILLLTVLTLSSIATIVQAGIPPEKHQEIVKMLQITGTEKILAGMKTTMINGLKSSMPKIPNAFWTKFESKMDMNALTEQIIPLYDKYYTLDELKAINAFYQSKIGQKVLATSPLIFQESMTLGHQWGQQMGKEASDEYEKESGSKDKK